MTRKFPLRSLLVTVLIAGVCAVWAADIDFDGDGSVGFADFVLFAQAFGSRQARYDLDGDGLVGFGDFVEFARAFGPEGTVVVRDLGTPVRSVNWVRLHPGDNGKGSTRLYVTMGQQADNLFVLQIDPETGGFRQFVSEVPKSNYPTAPLMTRRGVLYVGSAYAGHLLRFDPRKDALEGLGAIHRGAATFPCRLDEDLKGRIWIGSYPTANLACYDPATGSITRYGRMDPVDMYNYPYVNTDGTIACLIRMTRPHVVVFDPETGQKQSVGPVAVKGEDTLTLRRGTDRKLYIVSSLGNYVLQGTRAVSVTKVPAAMPSPKLPDGSTFAFADAAEQINRKLTIRKPNGTARTFELGYEASGSDIFYLHLGPDSSIYGSSVLPLHLFRYDPGDGSLADLGKCSASGGEAYSMANMGGKVYISAYPASRVSVYDPAQPYHFGSEADNNPRDLGRIDDISYRPRSTLAGPFGRVWLASLPDYGRWGGPLSYLDPSTGYKRAFYEIAGEGSCYTLALLKPQGVIAVGTSIYGGSGTTPKVDRAHLFLWDYLKDKKVWEGTPDRRVAVFNALVAAENGKLYGTVRGYGPDELFEFDPVGRTFGRRAEVPEGRALDLGLQNGPDGMVYGFTTSCIYRLDPDSMTVETVYREEGAFDIAGPILGREITFATGHRLRAAAIF